MASAQLGCSHDAHPSHFFTESGKLPKKKRNFPKQKKKEILFWRQPNKSLYCFELIKQRKTTFFRKVFSVRFFLNKPPVFQLELPCCIKINIIIESSLINQNSEISLFWFAVYLFLDLPKRRLSVTRYRWSN